MIVYGKGMGVTRGELACGLESIPNATPDPDHVRAAATWCSERGLQQTAEALIELAYALTHDRMTHVESSTDDFYVEDEPLENVKKAWDEGIPGVTKRP